LLKELRRKDSKVVSARQPEPSKLKSVNLAQERKSREKGMGPSYHEGGKVRISREDDIKTPETV